ncbi:glycosyltransferase family 4 protein [Sulfitobacter sp. 1A13368]|uniref:glycosyltransferase family 4 protein n=1 Tax=Sulfitobacter sp. 1A13368 TaxID=3368593 RepID=UPI003746F829
MIDIVTPSFDPLDGGIQALSKTIRDNEPAESCANTLLMNWKYFYRAPRKNYTLYIHGLELFPNKPLQKACLRALIALAPPSKIIYVSQLTKNLVEERYNPLRNINSRIIHNPIPETYFDGHQHAVKDKLVLTVCRAVPRKNLKNAFTAFRNLKLGEKGWKYVYIGDGPLRESLEKEFPEVEFWGRTSEKDKQELLKRASIFLHPQIRLGTDFEGFGLAPVEAIAEGAIPIIGEICGLAELITEKSFLTSGSVGCIERKLCDALANQQLLSKKAEKVATRLQVELNARERVEEIVRFVCE